MTPAVRAWVGLGGNTGDPLAALPAAFAALRQLPDTGVLATSKLYRTPAWGLAAQPDFINAAALLETKLAAASLMQHLLDIEHRFGRERRERWGPRILDLDLLLYGDEVINAPGLKVPHPHVHERAFALIPMLEIDPDVRIPGHGSARDALAALACEGIQAVG
jgi:2-amino-4-hydroxy-6-hydroxymethyldihydropteridine diphosphokinase